MRKLILFVAVIAVCSGAWADTTPVAIPAARTIRVGLYIEAPFAMKADGGYSGYAVDLWNEIAAARGWTSQYIVASTLPELVAMTRDGRVDVAVSDMSITSELAQQLDFSLPYFDSGLQIMIDENRHPGTLDLLKGMALSGHLRVFAIGGLLILVATIILTLIDRRLDPEFDHRWGHGLAQSFYHVMQTTFTGNSSHKLMVRGPFGYIAAALWVAAGVTIVAYITSSITSVMTANQIRSQIDGPEDLPGKTVGTIRGSAGEDFCRSQNLNMVLYDNLHEAVRALVGRQVNAIVHDAPILRYYDNSHPELPITEVGPVFQKRKYGFALQVGSPMRRTIDERLLQMNENGSVAALNSKYFGEIPNVR